MQITSNLLRRARSGYALVVVMISMALLVVVFASMMYWAATNAKITVRNNIFNAAESAAESSTENILTYMIRDFSYGSLNSVSSYNTLAVPTNGWPVYYQFSDTNNNTAYTASVYIGNVPTTATALNSQFAGLYGFAQPVVIASTAAPQISGQNNLSATVYQSVEFALIPLFQFAIFYNMDLEINPGAAMTINGHVHSNDNIWATGSGSGASALVFSSDVDAAGTVSNLPSPLDPQNQSRSGNVTYSAAGNPIQDYTSMSLPIAGTTNNNPTNILGILNQPPVAYAPPNYSGAYSTNGMVYFANASDLIVSNPASGLAGTFGTNISVYYQNPNNSPNYLTLVPPDVLIVSNVTVISGTPHTNLIYTYSFVTNVAFYDYRESDTNQAVQINVSALNTWLTNTNSRGGYTYTSKNTSGSTSKGHQINSIFVYNKVPLSASQSPAVRMVNGAKLPNISGLPQPGLTVATAVPLYVKGNYNTTTNGVSYSTTLGDTTNTVPAALLADAVTLLSSNWSDAYNSGTLLAARDPADIVVNAATLEGIVPSDGNNYSGGVENFLRLLEDWGGHTITYNGSIVVMFPSQYATNFWQATGIYYNAPTRHWGFDLNFNNAAKLPPLTPTVKAVIRGNYYAW